MKNSISKILVIGVDCGTWDVLGQACDRGWMPNLDRFRKQGCTGTLLSTIPPNTPAAWGAFMTGQNPGHHGVLGFQEYDLTKNKASLTSSKSIRSETLWQKLARHGKRVVVVGVPMTYPPFEVNGILVSGFESPSVECEFTYPESFKQEILQKIPDFTFNRRYRRTELKKTDTFAAYIKWLKRQSDQMIEILEMGLSEQDWDVSMVLFRSFDELVHHFWKLLDFSYDTSYDPRDEFIPQYFRDLDEEIGRLLQIAEDNKAVALLISDHGGRAKLGHVYPNRVLRKLNYLKLEPQWRLFLQRFIKRLLPRFRSKHPLPKSWKPETLTQQINLDKTKAFVVVVNGCGDLHIQVKSKYSHGIVDPEDADIIINEIADALCKVVAEDGKPVFDIIERPQKIYGLKENKRNFPDLIISPRPTHTVHSQMYGNQFIDYAPEKSLSGDHSLNGMFGALGPGIQSGKEVNAEIIDIAPTILAALGLPVTEDMNGRVIKDIFQTKPDVAYESAKKHEFVPADVHSQKEESVIASRLADLGYF